MRSAFSGTARGGNVQEDEDEVDYKRVECLRPCHVQNRLARFADRDPAPVAAHYLGRRCLGFRLEPPSSALLPRRQALAKHAAAYRHPPSARCLTVGIAVLPCPTWVNARGVRRRNSASTCPPDCRDRALASRCSSAPSLFRLWHGMEKQTHLVSPGLSPTSRQAIHGSRPRQLKRLHLTSQGLVTTVGCRETYVLAPRLIVFAWRRPNQRTQPRTTPGSAMRLVYEMYVHIRCPTPVT
jgi:hypothetical protein